MITHDELKLLCDLSRLYISEEELESYGKEMTDIIELMDTIGESDFEYAMKDMPNAVQLRRRKELHYDENFGTEKKA